MDIGLYPICYVHWIFTLPCAATGLGKAMPPWLLQLATYRNSTAHLFSWRLESKDLASHVMWHWLEEPASHPAIGLTACLAYAGWTPWQTFIQFTIHGVCSVPKWGDLMWSVNIDDLWGIWWPCLWSCILQKEKVPIWQGFLNWRFVLCSRAPSF